MSDNFQQRGGSPWGTPPGGGNGNGSGRRPTPPDVDKIIRDNALDCILMKNINYFPKYIIISNITNIVRFKIIFTGGMLII